jgi:hypothetical protein
MVFRSDHTAIKIASIVLPHQLHRLRQQYVQDHLNNVKIHDLLAPTNERIHCPSNRWRAMHQDLCDNQRDTPYNSLQSLLQHLLEQPKLRDNEDFVQPPAQRHHAGRAQLN